MPTFVTCPLCLGVTGRARTAPEMRFAEVKPFDFSATTATVIPCLPCREYHGPGLVSVELRKSRVLELAHDEPAAVRHRDGLVLFADEVTR